MKTIQKKITAILLIAISCVSLLLGAPLELTYPSEKESLMQYGRDFYVIGQGEGLDKADLTITVLPAGSKTPVRVMKSEAPHKVEYYSGYSGFNVFNADKSLLYTVQMPDLVWDSSIPGSYSDSFRKITVTDEVFCAVISGGVYQGEGSNLANGDGGTYPPLENGRYTIRVTIEYPNGNTDILTRDITIGVSEVKVLSRFSPSDHWDALMAEAHATGQKVYTDPFVGYWGASGILYGHHDNPLFAELLDKWQYNDALEYTQGYVNFYIYNVNANCATNAVEIGIMQKTGRIEEYLSAHYYLTGEPKIYLSDGRVIRSGFEALDDGDTLQFTRTMAGSTEGDNLYSTYIPVEGSTLDLVVSNGVSWVKGETLSFFGVVPPVQHDVEDVTVVDASRSRYAFDMKNPISAVKYEIYSSNKKVSEVTKPVGIRRNFAESWKGQLSIYEFKHDLVRDPAWGDGALEIKATALDAKGKTIAGSEETIGVADSFTSGFRSFFTWLE